MFKYNRKKEIMKNVIYISVILLLAICSTYYIYHKFQDTRSVDVNSESLDITYLETEGNLISITKVTPVTDSVGLSSKAYNITIKNNLTEKVNYKVLLEEDLDAIEEHLCSDKLIPYEDIKVSVKVRNETNIYDLTEIEDNLLVEDTIEALEKVNISIRVWVKQESSIPMGSKMHYHGKLSVFEVDE